MFDKSVYHLQKLVNKNIKSSKPCNKFIVI